MSERALVQADPNIEALIFSFLNATYVQRADRRQKSMGLQYMEAETHDLARRLTLVLPSILAEPREDTP